MGLFFEEHGLGHLPDLYDYRDSIFSLPAQAPALVLPWSVPQFDLWFPIYDQHQDNACSGFSVKEAAQIAVFEGGGPQTSISAAPLWFWGRRALGWENVNGGCRIRDVIQAGNAYGFASDGTDPYEPGKSATYRPSAAALEQASDHKGFDYASVETVLAAKQACATRRAVVFGTTLTESFDAASRNGGFFPLPAGRPIGAHAMTIVGYDDTINFPDWATKGGFRIRNHWRKTWGDKGWGWLPYVHFASAAVSDAWVLRGIRL